MLTTEEAKRIAKIMFDGGRKDSSARIVNIVNQIKMLPDAVRVNFDAISEYVATLYNDEALKTTKFQSWVKRY